MKQPYAILPLFVLIFTFVVLVENTSVARLRFHEAPDVRGLYRATAKCAVLIDNFNYSSGECHVVVQEGSNTIALYFGPPLGHKGPEASAYIESSHGKIRGMWSGPIGTGGRPDNYLGSLELDGDCWINKKVKICVDGRAQAFFGRCILAVKGHTYIDQDCPIESFTPLGEFYINDGCNSVSPYFAQVVPGKNGLGRGSWNGDPPSANAASELGVLKREGACWSNDVAKICAYSGRPRAEKECEIKDSKIPEGYNSAKLRSDLFEPEGKCLLEVNGRRYIDGKCEIDTENTNEFAFSGTGKSAGYAVSISTSKGLTQGAWNGEFGQNGYDAKLGLITRVGDCWTNQRADRVCVFYPSMSLECDSQNLFCRWSMKRN